MDPWYKKAAVSITGGHKAEFDWEREDQRKLFWIVALSLHVRYVHAKHHQASAMLCLLSISPSLAAKQKQLTRLPRKYIEEAIWRDKHMQSMLLFWSSTSTVGMSSLVLHFVSHCCASSPCLQQIGTLKAVVVEKGTGLIKQLQQQGSSGSTEMLIGTSSKAAASIWGQKRCLGPLYNIMVIKWHPCRVTWETLVSYQFPGIVQVNLSIWVLSKGNQALTEIITCDMWSLGTTSVATCRTEVCGRNAGIFLRCFRKSRVD